jgi:hypothetical protein
MRKETISRKWLKFKSWQLKYFTNFMNITTKYAYARQYSADEYGVMIHKACSKMCRLNKVVTSKY